MVPRRPYQQLLKCIFLCCFAQQGYTSEDSQGVDSAPDRTVRAAENIDLKKVVTEPLSPTAPTVASEPDTKSETVGDPVSEQAIPEPARVLTPASPSPEPTSTDEQEAAKTARHQGDQKPLALLQNEVLPGTAARLAWSPSVSFLGISVPIAVLVVNGVKPGPTVCLTAAIHGDELNGIEIVRRVLYDLDPKALAGAVIGIPIVNVEGFRAESRYLSDRRDLNRHFPGNPNGSAASRIAYSFFNEVLSQCDQLIDLHTGSFRRTNLPQLRADLTNPSVEELTTKMGSIVVLQSKGARGSLRRAATENGIPAVTLEAGAPHELQNSAIDYGVKSVQSALGGLGLTKGKVFRRRADEPVYYKSFWVRASEGGILLSEAALGDRVKKGDLLGAVTDPITNRRSEIRSPSNGRVIGMALNQIMHPGFAAYHIGIKASVVDAASDAINEATGDDSESSLDTELSEDSQAELDDEADDINADVFEFGEESD